MLPHRLQQLLAAVHPARRAGELEQQPQLGRREGDRHATFGDHQPGPIDGQVPVPLQLRLVPADPPEHRANACLEHPGLHRLDHVVVGARLQPGHHVHVVGARGQHDDRYVTGGAYAAADLESVYARQHQIEHDDVGQVRTQPVQPLLAGLHRAHAVPVLGQGQLKALPHGRVILDQQHSRHAAEFHRTLHHSPAGQPIHCRPTMSPPRPRHVMVMSR